MKIGFFGNNCKHKYTIKEQRLIDVGLDVGPRKIVIYVCEKCGKEKIKFV